MIQFSSFQKENEFDAAALGVRKRLSNKKVQEKQLSNCIDLDSGSNSSLNLYELHDNNNINIKSILVHRDFPSVQDKNVSFTQVPESKLNKSNYTTIQGRRRSKPILTATQVFQLYQNLCIKRNVEESECIINQCQDAEILESPVKIISLKGHSDVTTNTWW